MDAATIAAAISGLNGGLELLRHLKGDREKMADLKNALVDGKAALADAKEKILELEGQIKLREEMEFRDNVYWSKTNDEGPFCPNAWMAARSHAAWKTGPTSTSGPASRAMPWSTSLVQTRGALPEVRWS